jgi:hypothetical protein
MLAIGTSAETAKLFAAKIRRPIESAKAIITRS